ncbi:MAG TPA: O-antigen ligase family protein [Candidatus Binatia bacterium]|nr:O-antigen ligase family protein [Candidatus Binatia bacterium]
MNFGLESYLPYGLYFAAIIVLLLTIFWRPIIGLFYLLPLIPLQTIRYRVNDLPLGASLFGIMLLGVAIGQWRLGRPIFPKTPWRKLLAVFALFTFISLCLGSLYLKKTLPFPGDPRFSVWQEYMMMPALLLLVASVVQTKREIQAMVLVMCLATLELDKSFWNEVSDRDFSSYSDDLHGEGGSMGYAGANGLAAFASQAGAFLLALAAFERRKWVLAGYYSLAAFSAICLMYSLSRGGYAAFLVGCLVIGLLKQRKILLLLVVFLFTWTTLVPPAVEQRVGMTYNEQSGQFDGSANARFSIWSDTIEVFNEHAFLGTGFDTYEYMNLRRVPYWTKGYYSDTHNYFLKVLVETGIAGLLVFLWLLARTFGEGYRLFRHARDPFFKSLGLGMIGWLVCAITANLFGDRWTYLQVNGYMWVIAGLVYSAHEIEKRGAEEGAANITAVAQEMPYLETPPVGSFADEPSASDVRWDCAAPGSFSFRL